MLETSHHALIQYRLPTTGEIVPLLQIAPSKTDAERVLLVSPELADVLAAIIRRVRDPRTGGIPLLAAYDYDSCSSGTSRESAAPCFGLTPHSSPDSPKSETTFSTASPRPNVKAGSVRSKDWR
ncbi:hypothetical protein [Streptomyces sp. NPDC051546]|uniref:hypothetical protein n=1 Tax=Streptomyces sp. NPDC051546 TaxID=3365655 RepID=UPI00379BD9BC